MSNAAAQANVPELRAGTLAQPIHLDGVLDEPEWASAPAIGNLTVSEPTVGSVPADGTIVRVLASPQAIVIGVRIHCPCKGELF